MSISVSIYSEVSVDARWVEAALRDDVGAVTEVVEKDEDRILLWYDGLVVYSVRIDGDGRLDGRRVRMHSFVSLELIGYKHDLRAIEVFGLRLLARLSALEGASVLTYDGGPLAASRGGGATIVVRKEIVGDVFEQPDLARSGVPYVLGSVHWSDWAR